MHLARRNPREVQRTYEQLAVVCHAHGIAQEIQWAAPLCGRALLELGDAKRGLRVLEEGLAAHTITRSALLRPYYFVLLAGALLRVKEYARAQRALDDARAVAVSTSQNAYASEQPGCRPSCCARPADRRRRTELSRCTDDGADPGRAMARAARGPRVRELPGRGRPRRRGASILQPSSSASPKVARRSTTCTPTVCS